MSNLVPHRDSGLIRPIPQEDSANTLKNRIEEFIRYKTEQLRRPKTLENLRRSMTLLEIFVSTRPLSAKNFTELDAWMIQKFKLGPVTINLYFVNIRAFFRWCRQRGYMTRDLCEDICEAMITPPKPAKGYPLIFSHAEYERLRDAADGSPLRWAFILAYHTGLSLVDCCHLRWIHVDWERMWIRCARIKIQRFGDSAISEVPIITDSDLHLELINLHHQYQTEKRTEEESDYVCPELMKLYSWKDSNIKQTMSRFIRRYTSKGKTFHTFRRTFVSIVVNSGLSTVLACKLTAHSDPKMLLRYLKPDDDALRAGVAKALEDAKNKTTVPMFSQINLQPKNTHG